MNECPGFKVQGIHGVVLGFGLNNNNKEVDKFIKGDIGGNHWICNLPYLNTQRPG